MANTNEDYHSPLSYFIPIKGCIDFFVDLDRTRTNSIRRCEDVDQYQSTGSDLFIGTVLLGYHLTVSTVLISSIWSGLEHLLK